MREGRSCLLDFKTEIISLLMFGGKHENSLDKQTFFLANGYSSMKPLEDRESDELDQNDYLVRLHLNSLLNSLDKENSQDCEIACILVNELLALSGSPEFETNGSLVFPNSMVHRRKIRLWMSILVLMPYLESSEASFLLNLMNLAYENLLKEAMQSTRYYIEWFLMILVSKHVTILGKKFLEYFDLANEKSCVIISMLSVLFKLTQHFNRNFEFLLAASEKLIPWFLSNNFTVRLFAVYIFNFIFESIKDLEGNLETKQRLIYEKIVGYAKESVATQKTLRKFSNIFILKNFDIYQDFSLQFIFCELPKIGEITKEIISPVN